MPYVPPLALIHPLGCSQAIWDEVSEFVSAGRHVIRCDLPGHGARRGQAKYPDTLDALVQDAMEQIDVSITAMGKDEVFDVAGLSIGGLVALGMARDFPARVRRLVVANSALYLPTHSHAVWRARAERACRTGMDGIVNGTLARCFTDDFRHRHTAACASVGRQLQTCDPAAYAALTEILLATDLRHDLASIAQPALVVTARDDDVVPGGTGNDLMAGLPHARHWPMAGSHFAPIEHAERFAHDIAAFLDAPWIP